MPSTGIKQAEKSCFSVIAKLLTSKIMVSYQIENTIVLPSVCCFIEMFQERVSILISLSFDLNKNNPENYQIVIV